MATSLSVSSSSTLEDSSPISTKQPGEDPGLTAPCLKDSLLFMTKTSKRHLIPFLQLPVTRLASLSML
jgi:hypothetical protein